MPTLPYHSTYSIIWFLMQLLPVSNMELLGILPTTRKSTPLWLLQLLLHTDGTTRNNSTSAWQASWMTVMGTTNKIKMLNFTSLISPLVPWSLHWTNIPQSQKHSGLIPQQFHYVNPNLHVCHNPCSHVSEPWPGNLWPSSTILNLGHQTGCTFMRPGGYFTSGSLPYC